LFSEWIRNAGVHNIWEGRHDANDDFIESQKKNLNVSGSLEAASYVLHG